MPNVEPLSEFNRNQTRVIEDLTSSGEPMYLTRNGRAVLVVMSADAYDREQSRRERSRQLEERTYDSLMRGYQDVLDGKVIDLQDADAMIREQKGW